MAVLGYLQKLKRDLGLDFVAYFLHEKKIVPCLILINWKSFSATPFFPF